MKYKTGDLVRFVDSYAHKRNPSKEQPPDYEWSYADDSYHVLDGYQPICEHCGQALPK